MFNSSSITCLTHHVHHFNLKNTAALLYFTGLRTDSTQGTFYRSGNAPDSGLPGV